MEMLQYGLAIPGLRVTLLLLDQSTRPPIDLSWICGHYLSEDVFVISPKTRVILIIFCKYRIAYVEGSK